MRELKYASVLCLPLGQTLTVQVLIVYIPMLFPATLITPDETNTYHGHADKKRKRKQEKTDIHEQTKNAGSFISLAPFSLSVQKDRMIHAAESEIKLTALWARWQGKLETATKINKQLY